MATFHVDTNHPGDSITGMVGCRRNGRPIPQVVVATSSGTLLVISLESSPYFSTTAGAAEGTTPSPTQQQHSSQGTLALAEGELHARTCWELKPFHAPITAVEMSPRGDCCVAACVSLGLIAFFRVVAGVPEVSMQLLGFYEIKEPRILAFAPVSALAGEYEGPVIIFF